MKKIALSILSVFVILGGLLFSACDKQVSLSIGEGQEIVELFTNNDNTENSRSKTIDVKLQNSNAGVKVEILKGDDVVSVSSTQPARRSDGEYSFDISCFDKSGEAEVKVYAIDDARAFKNILVKVNTDLESITAKANNSNLGSDLFVVRGIDKTLVTEDYFDLAPVTANRKDIIWTFENSGTNEYKIGEDLVAKIENGVFVWNQENINKFEGTSLILRATFKENTNVSSVVQLDVLELASIDLLKIGGVNYISDGEVKVTSGNIELKRNNNEKASVEGEISVNAENQNFIEVNPVVFKKDGASYVLSEFEDWSKYFVFNISRFEESTYSFEINATDTGLFEKVFGDFTFFFEVKYQRYNFSVSTEGFVICSGQKIVNDDFKTTLYLNIGYTASSIELRGEQNQSLNNTTISAFSSYNNSFGFYLKTIVEPSDVAIDNDDFVISIDMTQSALVPLLPHILEIMSDPSKIGNIYCGGRQLEFEVQMGKIIAYKGKDGSGNRIYLSSGDLIYLKAGEYDITGLELVFESIANPNARATLFANMYRITDEENLSAQIREYDYVHNEYVMVDLPTNVTMSSSRLASSEIAVVLYVEGLNSISGLSVVYEQTENFTSSELVRIDNPTTSGEYDNGVWVMFTIRLIGYNFTDEVDFWLEHITGKATGVVKATAYVPLSNVSVSNQETSAVAIYAAQSFVQDYETLAEGDLTPPVEDETLSKLVVEAGSNLSISIDTSFATLDENKVQYGFLTIEKMGEQISSMLQDNDKKARAYHLMNKVVGNEQTDAAFATEFEALSNDKKTEKIEEVTTKIFERFSKEILDLIVESFEFSTEFETYFKINENSLKVEDREFAGIVSVKANGFDDMHRSISRSRYFALESVYAVKFLKANIENKTLYTTETLSISDMNLSFVDVKVSFRPDAKEPTFSNDLSLFGFVSAQFGKAEDGGKWTVFDNKTYMANDYYAISGVNFSQNGRYLNFRITANSTKFLTSFRDTISITYKDNFSSQKRTEISINIKNMQRIEEVDWLNQTGDDEFSDGEIYLNLTSTNPSERNFTISTAVSPSYANNISLRPVYVAQYGSNDYLNITTSSSGQTFNLNINTLYGGLGYLYLLPEDMIKRVDGVEKILVYKYSTSEGEQTETPIFIDFDQISYEYEKVLNGSTYDDFVNEINDDGKIYSNFFLNNDGLPVLYEDILLKIKVVIADGRQRETAFRIYSAQELQNVQYANNFYEIMNDLTFSGWHSLDYADFNSTIFGHENSNIVLTFKGDSESLVDTIGENGEISNLTFVGDVLLGQRNAADKNSSCGFVARENKGTISGVNVDVYYDGTNYEFSTLTSTYEQEAGTAGVSNYVGGIVGINNGTIENCFNYGLSINLRFGTAGGIAGQNDGIIRQSGVEFYRFSGNTLNSISNTYSSGIVGGIAGEAKEGSLIEKSYVYAYSLETTTGLTLGSVETDYYQKVLKAQTVGAFVGSAENDSKIYESFAFVGDLKKPFDIGGDDFVEFKNSYFTYNDGSANKFDIFVNVKMQYQVATGYTAKTQESGIEIPRIWTKEKQADGTTWLLDSNNKVGEQNLALWETENINPKTNFGFAHLKNVAQSASVSVSDVKINGGCDRILRVDDTKAVLFVYKTIENVTDAAQRSALSKLNEISLTELFTGIDEITAKSLLITTDSDNVLISAGKIRILSKTLSEIVLKVHSKMDFTNTKDFEFVIINKLPDFETLLAGRKIKDSETILLQKGTAKNVVANLSNSISLNGQIYTTYKDEYQITISGADEYVGITRSNNSLIFEGIKSHENSSTQVNLGVNILGVHSDFVSALENIRTSNFKVSVFSGATSLVIDDAGELSISPSEYAPFGTTLLTDNENDNLVFGLKYEDIEFLADREQDKDTSELKFVVDSALTIDIFWSKEEIRDDEKLLGFRYDVVVKVDEKTRHLIEKNYADLVLSVNALSQKDNNTYKKDLNMSVKIQEINGISLTPYSISNRQSRNSVLYYTIGNDILTSVVPGSDQIFVAIVDPTYAKMTHFTLTYSVESSGVAGTISISKLSKSVLYGYYADSANTISLSNGIRVDLTEEDKKGDGVFYFRVYVSTAFKADSKLTFTLTFYDGEKALEKGAGTRKLDVTYLRSASVLVNGASAYALSKGSSASVVVKAGKDQKLSSINLVNNYSGIILSYVGEEEVGEYKIFTYNLFASVTAKVVDKDGNPSGNGVFNVSAMVERVVNGKLEIKSAQAVVYLVDFAIDANNISVSSSGAKKTYNGKTYDAFYAYINSTSALTFNYPIIPEQYNYDKNNDAESTAVAGLISEQNLFKAKNYYQNSNTGYYINCEYNENSGTFSPMTLKEQLWYAESEDVSTKLVNDDGIVQRSNFFVVSTSQTGDVETLQISGKRSGIQLMKLRTNVWYQGTEFAYDYYFLIVVEIYSDEETPTQIESGEEFVKYLTESDDADDYILMNDIVLNDYSPLSTTLVNSFDGNGYTIHINSFAEQTGDINLALFNVVSEHTTLKNITVNVYQGGQIFANIATANEINVAGFAIENNGVIYNCQVVAYRDSDYQSAVQTGDVGIVVKYINGSNTDPIEISGTQMDALGLSSNVAGFVLRNNASITNSRVGGTDFRRITNISDISYVKTEVLDTFTIEGQGVVAGFAILNENQANIAASFVKNVQINNVLESSLSQTAGFVIENKNQIQTSFVEAKMQPLQEDNQQNMQKKGSSIYSMGYIAGFVYSNEALVKNCYSNIAIENTKTKGSYVAGFVYQNLDEAVVSQCYTACEIAKYDVNQMQFSGVDEMGTSLNQGTITESYFFNDRASESTLQTRTTSGAYAVNKVELEESFYGFNFAGGEDTYDGIWRITDFGPTLVSANEIAISNRYAVTSSENITTIFYNKSILDADTYNLVDLSYGSKSNPIIIRNAYDFAVATGKAISKEISSYKEYYDNDSVFGNYRLVNNIDFSEIDQNAQNPSAISLRTTSKSFKGLLDGNGFVISNISLNGNIGNLNNQDMIESFGLFARLEGAVVMGLKLEAKTIVNDRACIVGTLAGLAINSRILAVSLSIQENEGGSDNISVQGNNVVGGIVGMLLGESMISGIDVESINIYSSFNQGSNVSITSNENIGKKLRENIKNKNFELFKANVKEISYGGAVAGYVDIYGMNDAEFAKFSADVNVEDYNIVSVSVEGALDVYAEVAGGMFGYVGPATKLYNVSEKLSNPSHIISKHLYAGGIVGENYGGIFAASVSYADQTTIEESENAYYTSSSASIQRGQETIFSYTSSDQNYEDRDNDPLFVGGLVGFMGGGYIYVGYNRLNVGIQEASKHNATKAVGGIIGLLAKAGSVYQYTMDAQPLNIQTFISDVYASGDVYNCASGGVAAGLIGSISYDASAILLKNAMAVNYYSYNPTGLVGDAGQFVENAYASDKHFIVAGKLFNGSELIDTEETKLSSNIYVISTQNEICALETAYNEYRVGNATVGGYNQVLISNTNTANLKPFGFKTILDDKRSREGVEESQWKTYWEDGNVILKAKPMGSSDMNTREKRFATMYSYFLPNGWAKTYWKHDMGELLPDIKLEPKEKVVFWDVYNTGNILEGLANGNYSNSTIILRGKINKNDSDTTYQDIDLTSTSTMIDIFDGEQSVDDIYKNLNFENFKGTLISYYQYFGNDESALVTSETKKGDGLVGGKTGSRVGIILEEKSLFDSLGEGATISGINFYFNPTGGKSAKIVEQDVNAVVFRNISLTYNSSVKVEADGLNIGLIAGIARATSFVGVKFVERNGATITLELSVNRNDDNINMGLLAGLVEQNSSSRPITISGVTFVRENEKGEEDLDSTFNVSYKLKAKSGTSISEITEDLNIGLLAGAITRDTVGQNTKIDVRVLNTKFKIDFSVACTDLTFSGDVYIGGYFGNVCMLNSLEIGSQEGSTKENSKLVSISENLAVSGKLYAGLIVGCAETNIVVPSGSQGFVKGEIYQTNQTSTPTEAYVGGFVGQTNSSIFVNGSLICDFSASSEKITESKLDENLYDYTTELNYLKPLKAGAVYAGGLVGQTTNNINTTSAVSLSGCVEIKATSGDAYFGGIAGQVKGNVTATSAVFASEMKVSVQVGEIDSSAKTAYVGGLFGRIEKDAGTTNKIDFKASNSKASRINQTSVISAKTIYAGVFGYIGLTEDVKISGLVVGGATKVWSANVNAGSVFVGGIVGKLEDETGSAITPIGPKGESYKISECSTFGDVMINYRYSAGALLHNDKLLQYAFGGIVGSASSYGGLSVSSCKSIMTNFNDKLTQTASNTHAGAIVGQNSGAVTYSGNQYSSGACLCYQEEAGNEDLPYASGSMTSYYGYAKNGSVGSSIILSSGLEKTEEDGEGSKLNPLNLNSSTTLTSENKTNGLVWASLVRDLNLTDVLADELTNVVLVGNGNKISVERTEDIEVSRESDRYAGGLVNSMGDKTAPTFNVISGVVLEANIEFDFEATGSTYFGGIVGQTFGNSIIYASSVNGEISIGGIEDVDHHTTSLNLSGFVGHMDYGMISECFSDAHLAYRADENGILSGIAYLDNGNTLIKSTYSAGLLETYLDNDIYTFAYSHKLDESSVNINTTNDVFECYSISQIKRNSTSTTDHSSKFTNLNNSSEDDGNGGTKNVSSINIVDKVYDSNYDITYDDTQVNPANHTLIKATKGNFALGYSGTETKQNSISVKKGTLTDENWQTISSWYFNPKINYGYASHNFGYLKNVTIYTRDESATIENSDTGVKEYKYVKVELNQIDSATNTFRAIPNVEKFEQMMNWGSGRYVLEYDISLERLSPTYRNMGLVDPSNPDLYLIFIFDGQNKTLDTKNEQWTTPLFNNVYGQIENLRLINVKTSGRATLANSFAGIGTHVEGLLSNVTIVGNVNNSTTGNVAVGGVVAEFTGTARSVEGLVNVTAQAGFVGGLFGKVNKNGTDASTITYSTNGGQVISEATTDLGDSAPKFTTTSLETVTEQTEQKFYAIAGGLVGYAPSGVSITSSYNANAVLAGYTITQGTDSGQYSGAKNFVAGGIVGYSGALTLTDCHNVGLVGAGNYTSTGYSYSGGLFGYATSVSATNCMNDGQVEAINKVTPTSEIKEWLWDSENNKYDWLTPTAAGTEDWTKSPSTISKNLRLTYNPGKARQVYAYGLGFAEGHTTGDPFSGSKTSEDNIKNDGNIGQVSQTTTLTIDRNGILNNDTQKHFYGKFGYPTGTGENDITVQELAQVYVNGLDAYGYPYRVYMLDTVQRSYGRDLNNNNDIYQAYRDQLSDKYYYRYEGIGISNGSSSSVDSYIYHKKEGKYYAGDGWNSGDVRPYAKDGATWHATEAEENGYEEQLTENVYDVSLREDGDYDIKFKRGYYVDPNDIVSTTEPYYGTRYYLKPDAKLYYSYSTQGYAVVYGTRAGTIENHIDTDTDISSIYVAKGTYYGQNIFSISADQKAKVAAADVNKAKKIYTDETDVPNFCLEGAIQPYASSKIFSGKQTTIGDATYVGYEAFLHRGLVSNLVNQYASGMVTRTYSDAISHSSSDIDKKISMIDAKNDANNNTDPYKVITINGESSAIVSSGDQLTSVYMPVTMDATFEFNATNYQSDQTLSKQNFVLSGNYVQSNMSYALQYYELTNNPEPDEENKVTATFKLYFSRGVPDAGATDTLTANLRYMKEMTNAFTLGNSNVINVGGKAGILVKDMTFGTGANAVKLSDAGIIDSINNGTAVENPDETFVYSFNEFIFGKNSSDYTIDVASKTGDNKWKIIAPGDVDYPQDANIGGEQYYVIKTDINYDGENKFNYEYVKGATLSIAQTINKTSLQVAVSTQIDVQNVTIDSNFGAGVDRTFELFDRETNSTNIGNAAIKSDGTIIVKEDSVNNRKCIEVDLSHSDMVCVSGISKIYFDNSKHYALMYDGDGHWYAYSDGIDGYQLLIEDGTDALAGHKILKISAPNIVTDVELRRFVQKIDGSGNILGANVITTATLGARDQIETDLIPKTIAYGEGTRRYGEYSITFASSTFRTDNDYYTVVDVNNYKGSIGDISGLPGNSNADIRVFGSGLGAFMLEHGVNFYDYVHTYVYAGNPSENEIKYVGTDDVYYELDYDSQLRSDYSLSGRISNNSTISLNANGFEANDSFTLTTYKTNYVGSVQYPFSDSAYAELNIDSFVDEFDSTKNYTSIELRIQPQEIPVTDATLISELDSEVFVGDSIIYKHRTYHRAEKTGGGYDYYLVLNIEYEVQKYSDKIVTIGTLQPEDEDSDIYDTYYYEYTIQNNGTTNVTYYLDRSQKLTDTTLINTIKTKTWQDDTLTYDSQNFVRVKHEEDDEYDYYKLTNSNQSTKYYDSYGQVYIEADVAVYDFDARNILFAKNAKNYQFDTTYSYTRHDNPQVPLTEISATMKNPSELNGTTYKLYKGVNEGDIPCDDNISAEITYWPTSATTKTQVSEQNETTEKYHVSHDTSDTDLGGFGTWDYSYSYRAKVERTLRDNIPEDSENPNTPKYINFNEETTTDFKNIILIDDIKIDKSFSENTINIIGNSFVINYVVDSESSNGYSLFGKNSKNILGTNFLGMTSLRKAGGGNNAEPMYYSMFVNQNDSTIKDTNVYGSMRNVANKSYMNIYPFVHQSTGTLSNTISYITVNGMDAKGDKEETKDVKTELRDIIIASSLSNNNYKSYNIFIAGNGKSRIGYLSNGSTDYVSSSCVVGSEGGKGGSIKVYTASGDTLGMFNGKARGGNAGIGSYGSNGKNGKNGNGITGGAAGSNGAAGSVTDGTDAVTSIETRTSVTNIAGNDGMIGYGSDITKLPEQQSGWERITNAFMIAVIKNFQYDENGIYEVGEIKYKREGGANNYRYYQYVTHNYNSESNVSTILSNIKSELESFSERREKWLYGVGCYQISKDEAAALKGRIDTILSAYGGAGRIFVKVEMTSDTKYHFDWTTFFFSHAYTITEIDNYRITLWTTGEYINTSGVFNGYKVSDPFTGTGSDINLEQSNRNSGPFMTATK